MLDMARLKPMSHHAKAPLRLIKSYYARTRYLGFKRHLALEIDAGRYVVKTVETVDEYAAVLRLRRNVFHKEYAGKVFSLRSDRDQFDRFADFLAVIDKHSGEVLGSYRLISTEFSNTFYSSTEFNLDEFFQRPGRKLELSRACISSAHRQGAVIALLWKGLSAYMQAMDADYFFGLSSIKSLEPEKIAAVYRKLEKAGAVSTEYSIGPHSSYKMPGLQSMLLENDESSDDAELPGLLRAYIKAGAKVVSEPAIDRKFRCVDFLTVLRVSELNSAFGRKYKRG